MEMRQRIVKPERIIFSGARSYALPHKSQPVIDLEPLPHKSQPVTDLEEPKRFLFGDDLEEPKRFLFGEVRVGDCKMTGIQLQFIRPGFFFFDSNIQSSGDDDSWGILHFDVYQDNGLLLWSSGAFWSPTIGGPFPWQFTGQFPTYIYDAIALAGFTSHC